MSEYTPTKEEIRGLYAVTGFRGNRTPDGQHQSVAEWRAEFDRWLAAHDADVRKAALEEAANAVRASDWWHEGTNINFSDRVREFLRSRAAALGDAPQMSSEQTNERDELILTVRDVDADYHGTGPLALSGAEAALIADAVLAAGYHRDAPNGGE